MYKEYMAEKGYSPEKIAFVNSVYELCERNYDKGGDIIIECWEPAEILDSFLTLDAVREHCGIMVDKALDARWGEDTDPELRRLGDWS